MKCLRCDAEMKQYKFNASWDIYGKLQDPKNGFAPYQLPHNPHSIFECENCGYMELSAKTCEEEDF